MAGIISHTAVRQKQSIGKSRSGYPSAVTTQQSVSPQPRRRPRDMAVRLWLLISIAVIVPSGFASKFYDGPGDAWVNNSLGGVLYVVFFCLLLALLRPRRRAIPVIVISVFVITCALETAQLWKPGFLQDVRSTFVGRTLIGTTFAPSDFVYYIIGAAFGWLWLRLTIR